MLNDPSIDLGQMEKLPTEVVCEILGYSELREIKLLRVAFAHNPYGTKWVDIGANLLFRQIYFSLGPQAMDRFKKITETERLQKSVRHLVIVDTQLDERLVDDQGLFLSVVQGAGSISRAQVGRSYETYCRVFKKWQKILDDGEDVALLTNGLGALPNVNKVSVIGGPSHDPGTTSYLETGPHAADFRGIGVESSCWSYRSRRARGYHRFDRRPFQNLLRCLCVAKIRPIKVELGNWQEYSNGKITRMGVPVSCLNLYCGLGNTMFDTVITTAFADVTNLSLQLDMNPRPYEPNPDYTDKDLSILFEVLPSLRALQRLTLGFIHWTLLQSETKRLLEGNTWIALESLSLRGFEISPATFTAFIQNHTSSLREIILDQVGLPSGCQDTWNGLISWSKPFLNLKGAKFHVYETKITRDGSDDCTWVAEDTLLELLFGNGENKDKNDGEDEEDKSETGRDVMEKENADETTQEEEDTQGQID